MSSHLEILVVVLTFCPVNTSQLPGHVPPILPDGASHSEALPRASGRLVSRQRPIRPADQSQESLQSAIQHAAGSEGYSMGDVGGIDSRRHRSDEREESSFPNAVHTTVGEWGATEIW
jgi:hypothetical protein